jgi:hypothetical protein
MRKNLIWLGEIERKLAKLSMTTFNYSSSFYLFYGENILTPVSVISAPACLLGNGQVHQKMRQK